jgi:thiol-disulfide isomerase/thioredoxin
MTSRIDRRSFLSTTALAALGSALPLQAAPVASVPSGHALAGNTLEGQRYELAQDAGKAVLVFFWSTDCAVCRDKMPELRANYEAWRDKPFQLVAVSLDRSLAAVREYDTILNRVVPMKQQFPMLWRADARHRDDFGPMAQTPTSFVLDKQHREVKQIRGRIDASLWDDIAELVLS